MNRKDLLVNHDISFALVTLLQKKFSGAFLSEETELS
jgi:hypothetical protein